MKLATYRHNDIESYGVVRDEAIVSVPALWPDGPPSLAAALDAGADALKRIGDLTTDTAGRGIPLADAALCAPLPCPPKVFGLAGNYVEHIREGGGGKDLPDDPRRHTTPRPFLMPSTTVIGPGDGIPWPDYSERVDHEIELAIVMGTRAKSVTPEEAVGCIAGYTIANDISARSVTHVKGRSERPKDGFFDWLHGKWADGFCPTGPWLVTADEIGDPGRLDMVLTVNGEVRQKANTSQMIFNVYEVVSFLSHIVTLTPGDLIATGTVQGVGAASGTFLEGGDVITCRIDGIGELTNTLGEPPDAFYAPCE